MHCMPLARSKELVVQLLDEETLVYDQKNHQAHCLGKLASLVWRHCDGQTSVQAVADRDQQQCSIPADSEVVQLALQELREADLLREPPQARESGRRCSRRQLAARLGGGAAAFLLAPLITSLTTRSALAQASPRPTTTPMPPPP
jgi:hypothetical protein